MVGKWMKRGDLTVQETDYVSGVTQNTDAWINNELTVSWGHQVDREEQRLACQLCSI